MKTIAVVAGKLYWLAVACIPLLLWYLFGTFRSPQECVDTGTCFTFFIPLDSKCLAAVVFSGVVLWPLCAWRLGGRHLWGRIHEN